MDYIYLKARAKINLALDVISKREDGYHNLIMIMQTLNLHDTIYIKKADANTLKLSTNINRLPVNEKNIVYKAAQVLIEKYNIKDGVIINLHKNIPISAGLGGGSSDCASTLIGMRTLFKLNITNDELLQIGKSLGADVPYCLQRGTMLAEGIGDKLTKLPDHPPVYVLLAKPPINVSTALIFSQFDNTKVMSRPNIEEMITNLKNKNLKKVASGFCNVLETVTEKMHPIIISIKEIMISNNALGAIMSGSGPTVYGYFENKKDANKAFACINSDFPEIDEIHLTNIFNPNQKGMI